MVLMDAQLITEAHIIGCNTPWKLFIAALNWIEPNAVHFTEMEGRLYFTTSFLQNQCSHMSIQVHIVTGFWTAFEANCSYKVLVVQVMKSRYWMLLLSLGNHATTNQCVSTTSKANWIVQMSASTRL